MKECLKKKGLVLYCSECAIYQICLDKCKAYIKARPTVNRTPEEIELRRKRDATNRENRGKLMIKERRRKRRDFLLRTEKENTPDTYNIDNTFNREEDDLSIRENE